MRILVWIDHWHWVFLAVVAPMLWFPSVWRSFAMLMVPGLWIIGLLAHRDPLQRTPLNLSMLVLAAMVLVSLYATYDIAQSLAKITGMVLAFGVFFAFARVAKRFNGWWGAWLVFCATIVGMASFALVSVQWRDRIGIIGSVASRLPFRIKGLPGSEAGVSSNELAGALVWGIPIFVVVTIALIARREKLAKIAGMTKARLVMLAASAVTVFTFGILVLTQSRGAYVGLGLALVLMLLVIVPIRWRAALVGFGVVIAILMVLVTLSSDAIASGESASALSAESVLDTWEGRVEIWSRAIYGIQDFPFTGMGIGTFRQVVQVLYPMFLIGPGFDVAHAHNEFLGAGLDLGIPGLTAFIALYLGSATMLWMIWSRAGTVLPDSFFVRAVALGLAAGLFAHLVYGMTDEAALGSKPGVLFWMILGLIAGLYDQLQSGRLNDWCERFGVHALPEALLPLNPESMND